MTRFLVALAAAARNDLRAIRAVGIALEEDRLARTAPARVIAIASLYPPSTPPEDAP